MQAIAIQSALAFLEGVAMIASPCILPVLPLVLAGGVSGGRGRPFGVVLGFAGAFTVLALLSREIFSRLGVAQDTLQTISYVLIALMGVVMFVPALSERFARLAQPIATKAAEQDNNGSGFRGGLALGGLIGVIWAPCAGPILAAALLQIITSETNLEAVMVIVMFALGAILPMLAVILSGKVLVEKLRTHTETIRRMTGVLLIVFAGLGLLGITPASLSVGYTPPTTILGEGIQNGLPAPSPAPEIAGITHWINSPPLTLAELKGKVVLVDFWTYSCINCIRTLPYLRTWYAKYRNEGFEILGVHAPEFAFETDIANVEAAVKKYGIAWPVAMDNNFVTWKNYSNRYWPAHYLIDREGRVVYTHFGEGEYNVTEHNIRTLLGLDRATDLDAGKDIFAKGQTPETYLGSKRAKNEWTEKTGALPLHHWALSGAWRREAEAIESAQTGDTLTLRFMAQKVFLVLSSANGEPVQAEISLLSPASIPNGAGDVVEGRVTVQDSRLYEIINLPGTHDGTVEIKALSPGLRAYAFTFEGKQD